MSDSTTLEQHHEGRKVVSVGPLDVDSAGELTARMGTHNKAGSLLRRHARLIPADLRRILSLQRDHDATEVARQPAFRDRIERAARAASGRHQFFGPDDTFLAAKVHEDKSSNERFVIITYAKPSGRHARGAIRFEDVDGLGAATDSYRQAKMAAQAAGVSTNMLAQIAAEGRTGEIPSAPSDDELSAQHEVVELQAQLDAQADPEPYEGYGEASADDVIGAIKSGETLAEHGRSCLRAIIDYEVAHKDRKTVVEAARDALAAAEAND